MDGPNPWPTLGYRHHRMHALPTAYVAVSATFCHLRRSCGHCHAEWRQMLHWRTSSSTVWSQGRLGRLVRRRHSAGGRTVDCCPKSGVRNDKLHPPCRVLPPGEFNGMILESLPVYLKVSWRHLEPFSRILQWWQTLQQTRWTKNTSASARCTSGKRGQCS